jgi:tripartite-type tricarboxylate transporter receptor subunit TctC
MFVRIYFLAAMTLIALTGAAQAQGFPERPVTIIVGFSPGGATDIVARILAKKLGELWNQSVVVENRLGASGTIAANIVAKSAPDGYTLLVSSPTSTAAAPGIFPHLPYNVIKDFVVVSEIATTPFILVVPPESPLKTFGDFVRYAKANPAEMRYGSAGLGSQGHLAVELLNQSLNVEMINVPFKGEAAAMSEVMAGRLSFMFLTLGLAQPLIADGKLHGLAISSLERSKFAMEYPTLAELGIAGFETESWNSLFAPSSLPKAILARLNSDVVKVLQMPDTLELFKKQGFRVVGNSSEQATAYLQSETKKWGAVIKAANIRPR